MSKNLSNNPSKNPTMEELLASQSQKISSLFRGQEVEGEIVAIGDKEIILDLGTKSEGVITTREIPFSELKNLKVGDKFKAFVYMQESEHGQVVLSFEKKAPVKHFEGAKTYGGKSFRGRKAQDWSKFINAQNQKSKLQGRVSEINKGGLIVEVAGTRGFLPNSQVGFDALSKSEAGLVGQDLVVTVIEVDQANNKLIFSQKGQVSDENKTKLKEFKNGETLEGKISAVLPFGLVVSVGKVQGLVFISDVSWDRVDDLSKDFTPGMLLKVLVLGLDEQLGRLNLSVKELSEDPFTKISEEYPPDEVVKGQVSAVSEQGVVLELPDKIEGFLPASKMGAGTVYEVGKTVTLLVDSIDTARRRINLSPFVTSTEGLIYK